MKVSDIVQPNAPDGRQVILAEGKRCIIPSGIKLVDMSNLMEDIVGNLTPAITFNQTIRLNNDVLALLSINTIVHECTHAFQERRMGWGYKWTYIYQCVLCLFKDGPTHIHEDQEMEVEARRSGTTISASYDYSTGYLDIEKEIKKLMNW